MKRIGAVVFAALATTSLFFCVLGAGAGQARAAVPVTPTYINAQPSSTTEIDVNWDDLSDNETGFEIYKAECTGAIDLIDELVATTGPDITSFKDSGLVPGTRYVYWVVAVNADGSSGQSPRTPVTVPTRMILFYLNQATYYLNGAPYSMPVPMTQVNSRNYVPLASLTQALGGTCTWDPATQSVSMTVDNSHLQIFINSNVAIDDGVTINTATPPLVMDSRIYVPLGFVACSLDCTCWWDDVDQKVRIFYPANYIPGI